MKIPAMCIYIDSGSSNSAVMLAGTAVVLGTAVGLLMFGNIGATNNNFNVM